MIAVDTSTFIAYFRGESGRDVRTLTELLEKNSVVLCPAVLTELLSDPKIPGELARFVSELPLLEIKEGFWARAGELRASLVAKRRKARFADCLIVQSCLDHGIALIGRDADFRKTAFLTKVELV